MSTDIKLSKVQINKLIKSGKNILAPLGLSAAMSATDVAIQKKFRGYKTKVVRFSNKDLDDMNKIVKALEDSDVLMKGITKTLKNDIKKGGALSLMPMLLGILGASLLTGRGLGLGD